MYNGKPQKTITCKKYEHMKRILIDMTFIKPESTAGVVVYIYRFVAGLRKIDHSGLDFLLLVTSQNIDIIHNKCPNEKLIVLQQIKSKIPHLNGVLNRRRISAIIKENAIDLFFSPYFSYESFVISSIPHIAVIHDAQTFILKKKQKIKGLLYRVTMKYLMSKVSQFVTISNFSKENISKIAGVKNDKIAVIYNSVDMAPSQVIDKDVLLKRYILNVNTIQPYKNLETLIRAFVEIKDEIDHNLIIKGKVSPYWTNTIVPIIKEHHLEKRVFLFDENISPGQLTYLYEHADLFVSPSLMEGFGYTPIEAAMCCVPVITTRETAIPETTMNLVNYYSPAKSFKALAVSMKKALDNHDDQDKLEKISDSFKKEYSLEKQAERFVVLFEEYFRS